MKPADTRLDANQRLAQALDRIEASRGRLRVALLPPPEPDEARGQRRPFTLRRVRARLRRWLAGTPLAPMLRPAWDAVELWWERHPWRTTGLATGRLIERELGPVVRSHPVLSVSVAAAAGAAFVAARPWQWQPVAHHATLAGREALDTTLRWSWQQLSQPAVQAALAGAFAAWAAPPAPADADPGKAEPPTGDTPGSAAGGTASSAAGSTLH